MRRRLSGLCATMLLFLVLDAPAEGAALAIEPRPSLRLGLVLGAPVGLSAAFDLGTAFAAHLTLSPPSDRSELGARLDFVYRLSEFGGPVLPLQGLVRPWFGPGLRWSLDPDDPSSLGVRVPFGVSLFVADGEAEIYAEMAPVLVLHPARRGLVEAGLGLRFPLF